MLILGVSDGDDPSVCLVRDNQVVAVERASGLVGGQRQYGFPWRAAEVALERIGASKADVGLVGVAGRFSPPFVMRRLPVLRHLLHNPFSPVNDAYVAFQALVRQSGWGAWEADLAAEWLDTLVREQGYRPSRVLTVDIHKALAEAAYRLQPRDDVLVFTIHPMGDGASVSVHHGRLGLLDHLWTQRGFSSLHVHLDRALTAMGVERGFHPLWLDDLAASGTADPDLVARLDKRLHLSGDRLSRANFSRELPSSDSTYRMMSEVPQGVAAASLLDNLSRVITGFVRRHVRRWKISNVVLGGRVFAYPRVLARIGELAEVKSVAAVPEAGSSALAMGAAAHLSGMAPHAFSSRVGPSISEEDVDRALQRAGVSSQRNSRLIALLCDSGAVARVRGPGGLTAHAGGDRAVLVRADDPWAMDRLRRRLALPPEAMPTCLTLETANFSRPPAWSSMAQPLQLGVAAPVVDAAFRRRYAGVVARDGRARIQWVTAEHHAGLHRMMTGLIRESGCGALAAFPFCEAGGPTVHDPVDAVQVWRRSGIEALQLGAHFVERAP